MARNIYEQYGYDSVKYEGGTWIKIPGDAKPYECKVRGVNSVEAVKAAAGALMAVAGDRDLVKHPLSGEEEFECEILTMANGLVAEWSGDNWLDPDTLEPMRFDPEDPEANAENMARLLRKAGGISRQIKHQCQRLQTFRDKTTVAAAGNSSRRSGSRRTTSASGSTGKSNGERASAPGR